MTRPREGKGESRKTLWEVAAIVQTGDSGSSGSVGEVGGDQPHNLF